MRENSFGYIHYYFAHYISQNPLSIEGYYQKKNEKLIELKQEMKNRRVNAAMNSNDYKEALGLLEVLTTPAGATEFSRVFGGMGKDLPIVSGRAFSGISQGGKDLSFSGVAFSKTFIESKMKYLDLFSQYISGVNILFDTIIKAFNIDSSLVDEVIRRAGSEHLKSGSKLPYEQWIIQQILKKNKGQFLTASAEASGLSTLIARFIAFAKALPQIEGGDFNKGSEVKNREVMNILAGKFQGSLAALAGHVGEMAVAKAADKALLEVMQEEKKMIYNMQGAVVGGGTTTVKLDPGWVSLLEKLQINVNESFTRTRKEDVSITVGPDSLRLEVGVTVKNYNFDPKSKRAVVDLGSKTSFLNLIYWGGLGNHRFLSDVLNVGGGHVGFGVSDGDLTTYWRQINDIVATYSILFSLSGSGFVGDSALFMVVGNKVLSMDQILDMISNNLRNNSPINYTEVSRIALRNMNRWEGDNANKKDKSKDSALIRSERSQSQMMGYLASTIMKVKIDLYALLNAN